MEGAIMSRSFRYQDHFIFNNKWFIEIARYTIYLLMLKYLPHLCSKAWQLFSETRKDFTNLLQKTVLLAVIFAASAALVVSFEERLFKEEFLYISAAYLVVQYTKMCEKKSISYGVGMACSFFEGYLVHVIPSDGARFVGFQDNIRMLEDREGVLFPVKKLFIVITKSLYCPPDLKEFNKSKEDVPRLEAMGSLEDVVKNVAGVKGRQYRNTAYRILRPTSGVAPNGVAPSGVSPNGVSPNGVSPNGVSPNGAAPNGAAPSVCLAAECATPLHTLHKVLTNRTVYEELSDIDVAKVVEDFTTTLKKVIDKSPQCRGKCDLVYYDDTDPTQNLAEILLERIRHFEPHFEAKIEARRKENILENVEKKLEDALKLKD